MPYYKDTENKLHYLDDTSFVYLLPDGCVLISDEEAQQLLSPLLESHEDALMRAISDVRASRAPILDALAGIIVDAMVANDSETVTAAGHARSDLKDITTLPAFLAATTYDEMKAAVMARYREIAAATPANVQTAFREVFAS